MIKKWFGWFDIYYAEMLLGIAFAIMNALVLAVGVLHSFGLDSYSVGEYSNW